VFGRIQIAARHRLFLPAAAQSPIELNETLILGAARLRKRELRRKQGALVVQDFEISRGSPSIAHVRKTNRLLQIRYGVLLADTNLMQFFIPDQRIGSISERALNRFRVGGLRLVLFVFVE